MLLVIIAAIVAQLFFLFTTVAVWDCRGRYWEIIRSSATLVNRHLAAVLGLAILFGAIFFFGVILPALVAGGAIIVPSALQLRGISPESMTPEFIISVGAGIILFYIILGCLVGPWQVWYESTLICLYRSWRSEPLARRPLEVSPDGKLLLETKPEEIQPPAAPPAPPASFT